MELPIVEFPKYIKDISHVFAELFEQERTRNQFGRLMTGFVMGDKHTIAHMNGLFTFHTNQCNLNRFVTNSTWKIEDLNKKKIELIATNEKDGFVVLDDYITEKCGKNMFGVDWQYDHCQGRNVWGVQIADCVLSGNGIYPLLSSVYLKKKGKEISDKHEFRTKIEIQKEHLKDLVKMGLNFSCVLMDSWYFDKSLVKFIESLGKDWISACKSNRLILVKGKWMRIDKFADEIKKDDFKQITLNDKKYKMKTFTVIMKGIGTIRILISQDEKENINCNYSEVLNLC